MKNLQIRRKGAFAFVILTGILFAASCVAAYVAFPLRSRSARENARTREEILASVRRAADFVSMRLLDENGKSRCDFTLETRTWSDFEPAWHTGQAIYALLEAHALTGEEKYLKAAKRAGEWWKRLQFRAPGALAGFVYADHGAELAGFALFTTVSDGTPGLFRLARATGDATYADAAAAAAAWLLRNTFDPKTGDYFDRVNLATGAVERVAGRGPAHYPFLRPNIEGSIFRDSFLHTGDARFRERFRGQCERALGLQDERGVWRSLPPNDASSGYIHPRFNAWYAEALFDCFEEFRDSRYFAGAGRTADFYAANQRENGMVRLADGAGALHDKDKDSGSALAFGGLLWLRYMELAPAGPEQERYRTETGRAAAWILAQQFPERGEYPELAGAYRDLRVRKAERRTENRDVGTSFGLRFLVRYSDYLTRQN